jgi:lipopolysaccharide export system permease protein
LLKILTRYVIDQVLRSFLLALVTITAIFVLFMVMAEATRAGLGPRDILRIVPFIIPSSLPYTVPVALLFAVSVVYGRMASDNEIMAVKTAGLSVRHVLTPAWALGVALTGGLLYASADLIPRATHAFRQILFQDFEDMLYKVLKKEGEFNGRNAPFYISCKDVDDRTLIGATFKHRKSKDEPNEFDLIVAAERATIRFDIPAGLARIDLQNSTTAGKSTRPFIFDVNGRKEMQYPLPADQKYKFEKRIQEKTDGELSSEQDELRVRIQSERQWQAVKAAMWIASGRMERVSWPEVEEAYSKYPYWRKKVEELETERHLRRSLALGTILFIWLGAPVGILLARRDFLSAFIACFLPIIAVYYPLTMAGVNLAKEGTTPVWIVYAGDVALVVVGLMVVWKVRRH